MPERNHLIGGTDAADLLGIGHTSPTALYMRLRGEIPDDFEGNTATKAGKLFEDRVAVPLVKEECGLLLERPETIALALPGEPRIGMSLDFDVTGQVLEAHPGGDNRVKGATIEMLPHGGVHERRHVAEIKLTGSRKMWGELEKVPPSVGAQAQFQMAVARKAGRVIPVVHVIAMFVPGFIVEDFPIEEDVELGAVLLDQARDMLDAVDHGNPPEPKDSEAARMIFLGKRGVVHACSDEEISLLAQLQETKASKKVCEEAERTILDALLPSFGDATEICNPHTGEILATWRPNKVFDRPRFETEHPALAVQYRKVGIDLTRLRKDHASVAREYSSEPMSPTDCVRPFKVMKPKAVK